MKRPTSFALAALLALTALFSCRKAYDYIKDHPDAYRTPCRITNFRVISPNGANTNIVITYDNKGNPTAIMDSDRVNPVGREQYFRYDKWNRLSDFLWVSPGTFGIVSWQKYAYIRPDYIVDTNMFYTGDARGPAPLAKDAVQYNITAYTLDAYGRIIKVWSIPNDPPHTPVLQQEMVYDANGNLPLPDADAVYDDKVNLFRTNKVWQFVFNNYSRNNLLIGDGNFPTHYNAWGLPLNPRNLERYYIYPFNVENSSQEAFVTYACSAPKGPVDY